MRAYIDSDILIWHLRGERKALNFLRKLRDSSEYELWVGALQRAEVVFFMRPDEEEATTLFLSQFKNRQSPPPAGGHQPAEQRHRVHHRG